MMVDPHHALAVDWQSKRALRRHHRERMIAHARRELAGMLMTPAEIDADALRRHDHLATCSCGMCGNPRKFIGERTRQEQRVAWLPRRGGRRRVEDCD